MIYNLLVPLSTDLGILNVFRYITFRSVWALLTALIISIMFGPAMIRWLKRIKCGQYIREDGPHHQAKEGTPTMGGIMILISVGISTLLWADLSNVYIWLTLLVYVGFSAIGFADDYIKVVKKQNQGLSAKAKFTLQCLVTASAIALLINEPAYSTQLSVPFFKNFNPDLGWFYLPFAMVVMVGASNAVNLTDGLDGLAIGPMVVAMACFAIFIYVSGHATMADYLQVHNIQGIGEVTIFCGAMVGAGLGFLWFNAHPAQVFMGDVGSLGLGGALGFVAVLAKQELLLAIVGGVFVFETLSVILQVGYFKLTGGKRIFKMAPLHHHFELKGIPESKIIVRFWILSILMALMALSTLKLR
ncbi:phospho-N-acetylmuramoyl-pentapeptide-transferase [Pseudodesulfovibrio sp. JC047]|uniref:phospho-N-acetylmuramoyl-pentapeptide- transferase n=1 Tax=Pseudodesulfovibrio sp. JC047 TaxID=2683199 RepID=UPI0013D0D595|nr:phospho-N-acetylmuramoyl-pentapeptide-transferase [Pseudodesulfovibrio sp. JC047]